MSHEAHDREYDKSSEHARTGIDRAYDKSVPAMLKNILVLNKLLTFFNLLVNVVGELIVAPQRHECTQTQSVREENLGHCVYPNLRFLQFG